MHCHLSTRQIFLKKTWMNYFKPEMAFEEQSVHNAALSRPMSAKMSRPLIVLVHHF